MLYMQERLSQQRYDTTKPAYLQTSSKQVISYKSCVLIFCLYD